MVGIRKSTAEETRQYSAEPAVVADVCQDTLKRVGKVVQVSQESGTIRGKVKLGFMNYGEVVLRITRAEGGTSLHIHASRDEGLVTSGGAEKTMAKFVEVLGRDTRLAGKSGAAW